jgi:hypothetical protein
MLSFANAQAGIASAATSVAFSAAPGHFCLLLSRHLVQHRGLVLRLLLLLRRQGAAMKGLARSLPEPRMAAHNAKPASGQAQGLSRAVTTDLWKFTCPRTEPGCSMILHAES